MVESVPDQPAMAGAPALPKLSSQRRLLRWTGAAAIGAVLLLIFLVILVDRHQRLNLAGDQALRAVQAQAAHLEQALALAELAASQVQGRLQDLPATHPVGEALGPAAAESAALHAALPVPFSLRLLDARGRTVAGPEGDAGDAGPSSTAAVAPVRPSSGAGSGPQGQPHWQVLPMLPGANRLTLWRAVDDPAHRVAGLAMDLALAPLDGRLQRAAVRHSDGGAAWLWRLDADRGLQQVAPRPGGQTTAEAEPPARTDAVARLVAAGLQAGDRGWGAVPAAGQDDAPDRLLAWQRLEGPARGLVVGLAVPQRTVLAAWHGVMPRRLALVSLLMGLGLFALWRLDRALASAESYHLALARGEAQLRALADNLPDIVTRQDRAGRYLYANAAVRQIVGIDADALIGRQDDELDLPAESVSLWRGLRERVLASGQAERLQFDLPGEGGPRTWESLVVPEPVADGQPPTVLVISRDITERKRLVDALRASEQRMSFLLDKTPAVIYSACHDDGSDATFYSANVEQLLGWRPQDFLADAEFWKRHVHPDDLPRVLATMAQLDASREPLVVEYRFRHRDGRWRWLRDEFRLVRGEAALDGPAELVGSCIDITDRHDAEDEVRRLAAELEARVAERTAQLQASELRYRRIFEAVPVAIHEQDWSGARRLLNGLRAQGVQDPAGHFARHPEFVRECLRAVRVLKVNHKAVALRRMSSSEGQPLTLEALFDTPEGVADFVGELLALWQGQRHYTWQRRQTLPDGQPLNLMLSMSLPDLDERSDGTAVVCFIDITEVDRLNAELDATVARIRRVNRELETFTYSVSHDLKAPLRGIDGYGRLLLRDHAHQLDDEGRQFLGHIRQATQHMGQLIDDLLAYSRLERSSIALTDVALEPLVRAVAGHFGDQARERGATLAIALPPDLHARADARGLEIALRNLLDNALKFGRTGVPLSIELGGARHEDGAVTLWVRDNGLGFDMRFHDRIFEIFQRLHRAEAYPGTGVGLAIVRKAMERMGGTASAEGRPGEGAIFRLEIPGPR